MRCHNNRWNRGFTLIELMVVMVLVMLALAAGYVYFWGSQRASSQRTLTAEMEDNARMAMEVIAQNLRMAGAMVDFNNYSYISNGYITLGTKLLHTNSTTGPDQLSVIMGTSVQPVGTLAADVKRGDNSITASIDPSVSLSAGDIISFCYATSSSIDSIVANGANKLITISTPAASFCPGPRTTPHADGETVYLISSMPTFEIKNDASSGKPVLYMDNQPLAENIEDLQFEFGIDRNGDFVVSSDEWTSTPNTDDYRFARLIRVTIVARTNNEVKGFEKQVPHADAADHIWDPNDAAYKDGYIRFVMQRVVKLRNNL